MTHSAPESRAARALREIFQSGRPLSYIRSSEELRIGRLLAELALTLYAQEILPFAKAAELARLSRFSFADLVTTRNIPRHYGETELTQDLDYARGQ